MKLNVTEWPAMVAGRRPYGKSRTNGNNILSEHEINPNTCGLDEKSTVPSQTRITHPPNQAGGNQKQCHSLARGLCWPTFVMTLWVFLGCASNSMGFTLVSNDALQFSYWDSSASPPTFVSGLSGPFPPYPSYSLWTGGWGTTPPPMSPPANTFVITWTFNPNFWDLFTGNSQTQIDPQTEMVISNQVALAMDEWAYAGYLSWHDVGQTESYQRMNPPVGGPFVDFRTVTLHELGHVLGLAHPDSDPPHNDGYWVYPHPQPSYADTVQPGTPTGMEVMSPNQTAGEYNHILSWDELQGYYWLYTAQADLDLPPYESVQFQFVPWTGPNCADLTLTSAILSAPGSQWYSDTVDFGSFQPGQNGAVSGITHATITYNRNTQYSIGTKGFLMNWDVKALQQSVNGLNVHTLQIHTRGTDNTTPLAYYNNYVNTYNNFQPNPSYVFLNPPSAEPPMLNFQPDPSYRDDLIWTFGPAMSDIPAGPVTATWFHPGLGLDVDDWEVMDATAYDSMNAPLGNLAFTVADSFVQGTYESASSRSSQDLPCYAQGMPAPRNPTSPDILYEDAATYFPINTNSLCAIGFSIVASDASQTTISGLKFADVTGMGLTLSNLNTAGLAQLQASNLITVVTNFGVHTLSSNASFVVLLQGGSDCLPGNILSSNNYLVLNRPDLLSKELFLAWQSTNSASIVENYSLFNEPLIVGSLPSLSIQLRAQALGTNSVQLNWAAPGTGFVLQQNADLTTTNWQNVQTTPTVVISPQQVAQNQVTVFGPQGQMFYRLIRPPIPAPATAPTVSNIQSYYVPPYTNGLFVATVIPNGADTTAWFQYGTTTNYGQTTATTLISSGTTNTLDDVADDIGISLMSVVTNHIQLVATNIVGVSYSPDYHVP